MSPPLGFIHDKTLGKIIMNLIINRSRNLGEGFLHRFLKSERDLTPISGQNFPPTLKVLLKYIKIFFECLTKNRMLVGVGIPFLKTPNKQRMEKPFDYIMKIGVMPSSVIKLEQRDDSKKENSKKCNKALMS
jgi:hypothetical protein